MIRNHMRSRTKKFVVGAGLASIVLGAPGAFKALEAWNKDALILPSLFILGGLLLLALVIHEQIPKSRRTKW